MSDAPHGKGWWFASDGKWYPPDQHPDAAQRRKNYQQGVKTVVFTIVGFIAIIVLSLMYLASRV